MRILVKSFVSLKSKCNSRNLNMLVRDLNLANYKRAKLEKSGRLGQCHGIHGHHLHHLPLGRWSWETIKEGQSTFWRKERAVNRVPRRYPRSPHFWKWMSHGPLCSLLSS
ncbi:hypothetical protein O6H91_Y324200 [Diphasiastrum complanatum]|nr:hypothetical protein O6H91_Y324200 [Diphasiastrum complanatum]